MHSSCCGPSTQLTTLLRAHVRDVTVISKSRPTLFLTSIITTAQATSPAGQTTAISIMDDAEASRLARFADAVHEKTLWQIKVLDQPGLLAKWIAEAKLAEEGVSDDSIAAVARFADKGCI